MSRRKYTYPGHSMIQMDIGDWRCTCGLSLSGGPLGFGRVGARDVMRFHVMDLEMAEARTEKSKP